MFTGIVEEVGRVRFLRGDSKDGVLRIAAKRAFGRMCDWATLSQSMVCV